MKYLFVCGGTGGHINPAIAVASYIRTRERDAVILFAGNPNGMESKLVPKAGFDFTPIRVLGFQRRLTWFNVKNNAKAMFYLMSADKRAKKILNDFKPDVVIGTGGYASGPLLRRAAKDGYPTLSHEQNAFPGVTTKLLSKYIDKLLLAVPEAKKYLDQSVKTVVTGNPVREEILYENRDKARKELGLTDSQICILSFGGSNGARRINEAMAEVILNNKDRKDVVHIHATGSIDKEYFDNLLKSRNFDASKYPNIIIREYIDDMSRCMAAADLLVTRSGALTLCEIQAAGKASILIPSPNVAANHQYHNAKVLVDKGAAYLLEEKDLTPQKLCQAIDDLLNNPQKIKEIAKNASATAIIDANERIYNEIKSLTKEKKH